MNTTLSNNMYTIQSVRYLVVRTDSENNLMLVNGIKNVIFILWIYDFQR